MKLSASNIGWSGVGAFVLGTILAAASINCSSREGPAFLAVPSTILTFVGVFAGLGLAVAIARLPDNRALGILLGIVAGTAWLLACAIAFLAVGLSGHCNS